MELSGGKRERQGGGIEHTGTPGLGLGEMRSSFGKAALEPGMGLGERRQSFGKAGVAPPGGFRERRGSISSLSGKEELTDYHQRQKEERLREQEVERLVSWIVCIIIFFIGLKNIFSTFFNMCQFTPLRHIVTAYRTCYM